MLTVSIFRRCIAVALTLLVVPTTNACGQTEHAASADQPHEVFSDEPIPREEALFDDAALRDVTFVSSELGWAVGDHGCVWRTADGGGSWQPAHVPAQCMLTSVCFLTDRIGWVAGRETSTRFPSSRGVIYHTRDGGNTWVSAPDETLSQTRLPPVQTIRFFGLESGIIVGEPTAEFSSGVARTADGGATWQQVGEASRTAWLTADFVSPDDGVVAGTGLSLAAILGTQLIESTRSQSLRAMNDVHLSQDGTSWLCGDGGAVSRSDSAGISWTSAATTLPEPVIELFDFRGIAVAARTVCAVGSPGSAVIVSANDGAAWRPVTTSQPVPLNAVAAKPDGTFVAVGELGRITVSSLGGETWTDVRGADRRIATLSIVGAPGRTSCETTASLAGDSGLRSLSFYPSLRLSESATDYQRRRGLSDANVLVGGNGGEFGWQFPRPAEGLELIPGRLRDVWNQQNEGRAESAMEERLVRLIRIWRPSTIIVDSAGDAVDQAIADLLPVALRSAGDPASFPDQIHSGGLQPWRVAAVLTRIGGEDRSALRVSSETLLPRLATTAGLLSTTSNRVLQKLFPMQNSESAAAVFRFADSTPGNLTQRLAVACASAPGDCRRAVQHAASGDRESVIASLNAEITLRASLKMTQQSENPESVLAQLNTAGRTQPPALQLERLQKLARVYDKNGTADASAAVRRSIVDRFPTAPAAADAAEWLLRYYSSAEMRRIRTPQTAGFSNESERLADREGSARDVSANRKIRPPSVTDIALMSHQISQQHDLTRLWDQNTADAIAFLRQHHADRANAAETQIILSKQLRRQAPGESRNLLARVSQTDTKQAMFAAMELATVDQQMIMEFPSAIVRRTEARPVLDGQFNDFCWEDADEIWLPAQRVAGQSIPAGLCMISHDSEFLYLAARIGRVADRPIVPVRMGGRAHDQARPDLDRLTISFDVDRDYATTFEFEVCETGATAERCWDVDQWNPEWFVAVQSADDSWRVEAAIPLSEISGSPIEPGTAWRIAVRRTCPGYATQFWSRHRTTDLAESSAANQQDHFADGSGVIRFATR